MVLKFSLNLLSNNGIYEKIAIRVAKRIGVKVGFSRDLENLYIYVEGDEEKIEEFSKELAKEMPISIFLKSLNAEIVDEFKDDLKRDFPKISLPPCPKCLSEVKDEKNENYFNPFHHCEVCGYEIKDTKEFDKLSSFERKKIFKNLVDKLQKEDILIQTMNGKFRVSKNLENVDFVVAKDLGSVARFFMAFEGDDKALASIEKPFLKLKTNIEFKKEYGVSIPAFDVKLPDDLVLELLFESGDFSLLGFSKSEKSDDFIFDVEVQTPLKAVVTDSTKKDILIYSGDRGVIPKFEKFIKEGIVGGYKDYISYSKDNKTVITKEKLDNVKEAKAAFAGFYGVVSQWNLEDKTTMGFCFYRDDESKIFINSPKFGLVEYINFDFKFKDFEEIFASISAMNETGAKLIKNFANKKEELFKNALNLDISTEKRGIFYLWGLIGMLLGFGKNIDVAANRLIQYANEAMTKKGPRIDYKLEKNNLNPLWAIRTAMSFHLAGVDNYLLSYGVIESFAEFLGNRYDEVNKESPLDGAIIVGNLFEGEFLNKIYSYIEKNYKVYTPKALPISGAIESFGSLVINSKI